MINVFYDADAECVPQIASMKQGQEGRTIVLPFCMGEASAKCQFFSNYDPNTSSRLRFNPEYASFYQRVKGYDYPLADACKTMETLELDLHSFDDLFASGEIGAPMPDFLSLDAQGAEYQILQGAANTINLATLAISLEAEFGPIYKDQKLFGDLVGFLASYGFRFVGFIEMGESSPYRGPVGFRGRGFNVWAEALFFKDIDLVDSSDEGSSLKLQKLAFIAIVFEQFEYAWECLRRLKARSKLPSSMDERPAYATFIASLRDELDRMPQIVLDTFASKLSFEESRGLWATPSYAAPLLAKESEPRRGLLAWIEKRFLGQTDTAAEDSDIERLFQSYGLHSQAALLKKNRLDDEPYIRR